MLLTAVSVELVVACKATVLLDPAYTLEDAPQAALCCKDAVQCDATTCSQSQKWSSFLATTIALPLVFAVVLLIAV